MSPNDRNSARSLVVVSRRVSLSAPGRRDCPHHWGHDPNTPPYRRPKSRSRRARRGDVRRSRFTYSAGLRGPMDRASLAQRRPFYCHCALPHQSSPMYDKRNEQALGDVIRRRASSCPSPAGVCHHRGRLSANEPMGGFDCSQRGACSRASFNPAAADRHRYTHQGDALRAMLRLWRVSGPA